MRDPSWRRQIWGYWGPMSAQEGRCWRCSGWPSLSLFFPASLSTKGPPAALPKEVQDSQSKLSFGVLLTEEDKWRFLTATTESRAATARMSAQETTWGQTLSTWDLMESTTSKPRKDRSLGPAVFSPVKLAVSSRRTDPSQPCHREESPVTRLLSAISQWEQMDESPHISPYSLSISMGKI